MKADQQVLYNRDIPIVAIPRGTAMDQLVLVFGSPERFKDSSLIPTIRQGFPGATIAGCSTCGEITRAGALEETITITSLRFNSTSILLRHIPVLTMDRSYSAGRELGESLRRENLQYVLTLSNGLKVNGSEVARGLRTVLGDEVVISGGLAGDDDNFIQTFILDGNAIHDQAIIGIGFYGNDFLARSSSASGWETFGAFRTVTKARGNVVYEIDGVNALDVYSKYLGDEARHLPSSGLLYPLALRVAEQDAGLIRTLLAVDTEQGSLTFAGDVPEGGTVCLMHADNGQLIDGARRAGQNASLMSGETPDCALLISCVGRKLVMGTQVDLEIEAVAEGLPEKTCVCGFYSYGEVGFYEGSGTCELHNQTMTVTTMTERGR